MPTEFFSLELGGPKRLEISWTGRFNDFTVKLDGELLAGPLTRQQVHDEVSYKLPDNSTLAINLGQGVFPELRIFRNNRLLPEFADIEAILVAGGTAFLISGLAWVLGILPFVIPGGEWNQGSLVFWSGALVYAIVFSILTYFIFRRSVIAIMLAAAVWIITVVAAVVGIIIYREFSAGIVVAIGMAIPLVRGAQSALALQRGRPE